MVSKTFLSVLAISVLAIMPVTAGEGDAKQPPRTLLEALDVSTPEATAEAFVAAYSRSDYFAAAFLFTFDAKTGFHAAMMSRDRTALLFPSSDGTVGAAAVHTLDGIFIAEQSLDFSVFFDDVMYQAELNAVLPFLISPDAEISIADDEKGQVQAVIDETVTLHLVQTRPDHWLVDRIALDGKAGEIRPW